MLDQLITRITLEEFAGRTVFRRGENYFSAGSVSRLAASSAKVSAKVQGSQAYQVELRNNKGELSYDCTCPNAADGYFCKHCVAVGLAFLSKNSSASKSTKRRDPWRDIKKYLSAQPPKVLVELLLEVAQRDDRLFQLLLLKGSSAGGRANIVESLQNAIDQATQFDDFLDWREVSSYSTNIDQVIDTLAELLVPGKAAALVELTEYAIERVEASLEQVDDSNGAVGDTILRLGELHLKACILAKSPGAELAEDLFRLQTTLPFGVWSFELDAYRKPLGKQGLLRYRELAQVEWRKLPPRDPANRFESNRFRITHIMESLALASGDIDELVSIKSQDLSSSFRYLGIAEIYDTDKQFDKALEWAERGLHAFPKAVDDRLRDFLVAIYLKRKRNDEALQLTWAPFEELPKFEYYQKLNSVAVKLGRWPEQRERALAWATEWINREPSTLSRWKPKAVGPDYSLLVEIALWEKDFNAAWVFAQQGTCHAKLLIRLASKLESSRAADAVSLYRRLVPPIVQQANNSAYDEAIGLIRKVGGLMKHQQQLPEFRDYLAELRLQFKPKRNFIKLLDELARRSVN